MNRKTAEHRGASPWIVAGRNLIVAGQDVTLEALCEQTGKTRGSFYHHYASVQAYFEALLGHWRQKATLDIVAAAEAEMDRVSRLNALAASEDHVFERALRGLGLKNTLIQPIIEEVDALREAYLVRLAREALGLDDLAAAAVARLGLSLFICAQLRAPEDVQAFSAGAESWLLTTALRVAH